MREEIAILKRAFGYSYNIHTFDTLIFYYVIRLIIFDRWNMRKLSLWLDAYAFQYYNKECHYNMEALKMSMLDITPPHLPSLLGIPQSLHIDDEYFRYKSFRWGHTALKYTLLSATAHIKLPKPPPHAVIAQANAYAYSSPALCNSQPLKQLASDIFKESIWYRKIESISL